MGAPVETYLWTLIVFSSAGVLVQMLVLRRYISEFSVREYFYKVILPEIKAYLMPLIVAVFFWQRQYDIVPSIGIGLGILFLCTMSAWWIGMTRHEREWINGVIKNKICKRHA